MEDSLKKLKTQLQNHVTEESKKSESIDAKIDKLARKFDVLMEKLLPSHAGILGSAPVEIHQQEEKGSGLRREQVPVALVNDRSHHNNHGRYNSRVEFPYFDGIVGADHCSWLRKCERYFHYNHVSNPEQKLEEVVLHLNGRVEAWYFSYQLSKGNVRWPEFCEKICKRFQDADNSRFNLIGEFKKMEHKGTINEYLEKFEDPKAWVLIRSRTILSRILCRRPQRRYKTYSEDVESL